MSRLSGIHPTVLALFTALVMLASVAAGEVAMLNSITFEQDGESSTYLISFSGDVHHQDFLMSNPQRLVVDLMGARNGLDKVSRSGDGKLVKGVRTSQFKNDPDLITRIVFDIEEGSKYKVDKKEGAIEVSFFKPDGAAPKVMGADVSAGSAWSVPDAPVISNKTDEPVDVVAGESTTRTSETKITEPKATEDKAPVTTTPATKSQPAQPVKTSQPTQPANSWATSEPVSTSQPATKSQPVSKSQPATSWNQTTSSEDLMLASRTANPRNSIAIGQTGGITSNKPITIDVQGADIKTVLRSISEFSGANIIAGPEVEGAVTIHLVNVPWKEALDTILKSQGYSYKDEYGIYRVQQTQVLHEEEINEVQVARKKEEMQPLVSRVVRLNYANAKEMSMAMKDATTRRGSVQVEKGSNAVIITDIPEYADRVAALCVDLDRKVSQVEIVAKLVDVDIEATREMGIKWDFLNIQSADLNGNASASVGQTLVDPFGAFRVGTVQSWGDLMVAVDALEKENKANIVSHPRVVTADNKEASILVGKEIPLIVSDEAGNPITELKKIGVILRVTPHVNSDQTITMDIHPEVSELSSQATVQGGVIISLTSADTRVIVADGETAVIGGLINEVESKNENGLPVLKDVPVFGNLFKYSNKVKKKRELIIFITPKIVG